MTLENTTINDDIVILLTLLDSKFFIPNGRLQSSKSGGFPEKSALFLYRAMMPDFYTAR